MKADYVAARRAKTVEKATDEELADELVSRPDVDGDWLVERLGLETQEPDEPSPQFQEHADEIRDIYDAVAEGRNVEALNLIYDLCATDVLLIHPKSALRFSARTGGA